MKQIDGAMSLLETATDGLSPEIMRQMLLGIRMKMLSSRNKKSKPTRTLTPKSPSFVEMVQTCDIDDTTK